MPISPTKQVCFISSEVARPNDDHVKDILQYNEYRNTSRWNRRPYHYYVGLHAPANGWHAFRRHPTVGDPLSCVREPRNIHDRNAVKVYWGRKAVGMIPKGVAKFVAEHMDRGYIKHVTAFHTGHMNHANTIDFGQGPKLLCNYFFEFEDVSKRNKLLNELLNEFDTTRLLEFP